MTDAVTGHGIRSGMADVNGATPYYESAGEGQPLVLLHAGIADSRMWDAQLHGFAERYHVIPYDARGFGCSDLPPGPFAGRDDLLGLLRALGIERAHLVGLSMGGGTALDFTLEHPEMVSALVLVASGISGFAGWTEEMTRFFDAEEAAEQRGDLDTVVELNLRVWVDGPGQPPERVDTAVREQVREMYRASLAQPWSAAQNRRLEPPAIGRLSEVRVPTLILDGGLDAPEMASIADTLAGGIAGARKLTIAGAAHMVNMEQPRQFERAVLEFLSAM